MLRYIMKLYGRKLWQNQTSENEKNNSKHLWKEVAEMIIESNVYPQCMGDITSNANIVELLTDKYQDI